MIAGRMWAGLGLLAALSCGTSQASAAEEHRPYGEARGWAVQSVVVDGGFARCSAAKDDVGFFLEQSSEGVTLTVTGTAGRPEEYKAYLDVSPQSFPVTFYPADNGRYLTFLDGKLLAALKGGAQVAYYQDGGTVTVWPLDGTAAALLKLQECADNAGEGGQAAAPPVESDAARLGQGCPVAGSRKSPPTAQAAKATFVNKSDRAVSIYWIDFDGQVKEMGATLPNESVDFDTFVGHLWLAKDFDWTCHGGVMVVQPGTNRFVFD